MILSWMIELALRDRIVEYVYRQFTKERLWKNAVELGYKLCVAVKMWWRSLKKVA